MACQVGYKVCCVVSCAGAVMVGSAMVGYEMWRAMCDKAKRYRETLGYILWPRVVYGQWLWVEFPCRD